MAARNSDISAKTWRTSIRHLKSVDSKLGQVIDACGSMKLEIHRRRSPFEFLLRSIIFQQLSGSAADTIHRRFLTLFPGKRPTPTSVLSKPASQFRRCGVSKGKEKAIRDLARHARDGLVPGFAALSRQENEEIIDTFTAIHGIGRWTVEMLLIFQLARLDVMPVGDLGVQKGFAKMQGKRKLPTPKQLERATRKWQPYRSIGSWYCWRATEL